ncbi:MAG: hypothetical protein GX146_07180 [Myxococcales bacterium]|jgi:hypothetical protein|nr:hypothetical protein [Myxococcales bacterium]
MLERLAEKNQMPAYATKARKGKPVRIVAQLIALFLTVLFVGGCYTHPLTAVASTIPIDFESQQLVYIGDVEGRACIRNVLFLLPLDRDASIDTAKKNALASIPPEQGNAIGLIDVSIDVESMSLFIYNRNCTIVRGKAVGLSAPKSNGDETKSYSPGSYAEPAVAPTPTPLNSPEPDIPTTEARDPIEPAPVDLL